MHYQKHKMEILQKIMSRQAKDFGRRVRFCDMFFAPITARWWVMVGALILRLLLLFEI